MPGAMYARLWGYNKYNKYGTALEEFLCGKKVLDFRFLCLTGYQVPCFSHKLMWTDEAKHPMCQGPSLSSTVPMDSLEPQRTAIRAILHYRRGKQFFMLISPEKGDMLYTGVGYWYCQL